MEYIDLWCIFKGCLLPSTTSHTPKTSKEADTQKLKPSDPFLGQVEVARAISSGGFQLPLRVLWCLCICSLHHKRHLQGKRVFSFSVKPEDGGRVWGKKRGFPQLRTAWNLRFLQSSGRKEYHLSLLHQAKYGHRTDVLPKHSIRFIKISKSSLYKLRKPLRDLIWNGFW